MGCEIVVAGGSPRAARRIRNLFENRDKLFSRFCLDSELNRVNATSGSSGRAWLRGGKRQHHLIDPCTGRPAESPWEKVTVCGDSCLTADVAAKAAFFLGANGPDWLYEQGLPGRLLSHAGKEVLNDCWKHSLAGAVACT